MLKPLKAVLYPGCMTIVFEGADGHQVDTEKHIACALSVDFKDVYIKFEATLDLVEMAYRFGARRFEVVNITMEREGTAK